MEEVRYEEGGRTKSSTRHKRVAQAGLLKHSFTAKRRIKRTLFPFLHSPSFLLLSLSWDNIGMRTSDRKSYTITRQINSQTTHGRARGQGQGLLTHRVRPLPTRRTRALSRAAGGAVLPCYCTVVLGTIFWLVARDLATLGPQVARCPPGPAMAEPSGPLL